MSGTENYGFSTRRWTKKQIWEFRKRDLYRRRKEYMEDYASGLPRDPDEEDWLEYMADKEESKIRTTEPMDTSAFTSPSTSSEIARVDESKWALIHDPSSAVCIPAKVIEDTGTAKVNFISPKLVETCHLEQRETAPIAHMVMTGHIFKSDQFVQVKFFGEDYRVIDPAEIFYVAPEGAPIDLLVGKYFLDRNPGFKFMDSEPNPDGAFVNVQLKVDEQERAQIESNRATANAQSAALERERQQRQQREREKRSQQQQPNERRK